MAHQKTSSSGNMNHGIVSRYKEIVHAKLTSNLQCVIDAND